MDLSHLTALRNFLFGYRNDVIIPLLFFTFINLLVGWMNIIMVHHLFISIMKLFASLWYYVTLPLLLFTLIELVVI